jgi:hypothetical protein
VLHLPPLAMKWMKDEKKLDDFASNKLKEQKPQPSLSKIQPAAPSSINNRCAR